MEGAPMKILCLFAFLFVGCKLMPKLEMFSPAKSTPFKSANYNLEKDAVIEIRQEFNSGHYEKAKEKSHEFLAKYPNSTFLNETLYYQGLSFETSEDWDQALNNYKKIIDLSIEGSKEFLALALYRKANCYEANHEPEMALASLFDALHYKAYLPIEVAEAEIPARMASIYASLKQATQADYYALVAEKGIRKARLLKKNNEQDWLGYTLLQMGSLSLGSLTAESFYESLLSFSRHQKYLLQTIELKDPNWSAKAEELLIGSYTNFWNTIKTYNLNPSSDWEMDFVLISEKQVEMASQLLESLEILKNYQAPEESQNAATTVSVFEKLKPMEQYATELIQKQILLKPTKKLKSQVMSGNFETTEFEDEAPKELTQKFPTKKAADNPERTKTGKGKKSRKKVK
jgi:tetratricopeptide (TPR) repeat protein